MTLAAVLLTLLPCVFMASGCLNNYDGHGISNVAVADAGHHHGLPSAAEGPINQATRLADKQESEFNHHLAGLFIVAVGMLILGQERLARRWPSAKYAWPLCFLVAGLFVLLFSDTEIWPWGTQSLYYALTHNPEDVQHKVFALILILVAWFEIQNLRGQSNVDNLILPGEFGLFLRSVCLGQSCCFFTPTKREWTDRKRWRSWSALSGNTDGTPPSDLESC